MQRIFGAKKPNTPQPTIGDAIKSTDERMQAVAVKINALDLDLAKLKEQLKKTPNNNAVKQRAIRLLKQRKLYEVTLFLIGTTRSVISTII